MLWVVNNGNQICLSLTPRGFWKNIRVHVIEEKPRGPSWDIPLPHVFYFSLSLKYLDDSI